MGFKMDTIVCAHCGYGFIAFDQSLIVAHQMQPTVEWLADGNGQCFADSIRVTHRQCQYADTIPGEMDRHNLWDRWFPLATLNKYIKIIRGMRWDDTERANKTINEVIQDANKRN